MSNSNIIMYTVYIGLGSNQGDSRALLQEACNRLKILPETSLEAVSSVYITEPQEDQEQPWFHNQVARIVTRLSPDDLLQDVQRIEIELGRVRTERRFGPRMLDLDLLLYGNLEICSETLEIPHPRMLKRAFVLLPLLEIEPDICLPDGKNCRMALSKLDYILTGNRIFQKK